MKRVRFGYVGCGFMAQRVHIPNFLSIPECDFIAIAEARERLGRRVCERYGIPRFYKSHLELAEDPDVEAVGVSAGFAAQGAIARDLLMAGKHVFMEKPMAVSIRQAEEMLRASKEGGGRLMVAYMKRYDAGNELVKELVDRFRESGELGRITFARSHGFCGDWVDGIDTPFETTDEPYPPEPAPILPEWLPKGEEGKYLGYLQQYTHNLNLLRWFLDAGDEVQVSFVDLDEDGMTGIVGFKMRGIRAVIESGGISYWSWEEQTQIYFQHGWIRTWAPPLLHKNLPAGVEVYIGKDLHEFRYPLPRERWSWSFKREAEHFIKALLSGEEFRSSGEDTLTDVRIFEEIYRKYLGVGD
jgi:predicted dehydrogenase